MLRHPRELHPLMGQTGASLTKPNLKYGETHPTELCPSTGQWCLLGEVNHTSGKVRPVHADNLTCGSGVPLPGRSNCPKQNGLCGTNRYSDNQAPTKSPWTKNLVFNCVAEVVSQGRSMTWCELLQSRMVQVGVSQCPTGGWCNHHSTAYSCQEAEIYDAVYFS